MAERASGSPILAATENDIIVGTATPSAPATGQIWVDTNTRTKIKKWNGSSWLDVDIRELFTATGQLPYASAAQTPAVLGIGSAGDYLGISGGVPAWASILGYTNAFATTTTNLTSSGFVNISGLSISLGAGTWLIFVCITNRNVSASNSNSVYQLYNSTDSSVLQDASNYWDASTGVQSETTTMFGGVHVLGGTKTIVARGYMPYTGSHTVQNTIGSSGTANKATSIWAIKIAP